MNLFRRQFGGRGRRMGWRMVAVAWNGRQPWPRVDLPPPLNACSPAARALSWRTSR